LLKDKLTEFFGLGSTRASTTRLLSAQKRLLDESPLRESTKSKEADILSAELRLNLIWKGGRRRSEKNNDE